MVNVNNYNEWVYISGQNKKKKREWFISICYSFCDTGPCGNILDLTKV